LLTPQAGGDTNRYLFSTKELDSRSGLQFFGARYYDPEIGRWLSPDPLGFVDGVNQYTYVNNNPVNWVDPNGLCIQELERIANMINPFSNQGATGSWGGTPWGDFVNGFNWPLNHPLDSMSLALFAGTPYEGQVVYRLSGGTSSEFGASWTPVNPLIWGDNAANKLGLPAGNTQENFQVGRIVDSSGITVRAATPLDGNSGGATEYVIPNTKKQINQLK